jgi:hypothetical protein
MTQQSLESVKLTKLRRIRQSGLIRAEKVGAPISAMGISFKLDNKLEIMLWFWTQIAEFSGLFAVIVLWFQSIKSVNHSIGSSQRR